MKYRNILEFDFLWKLDPKESELELVRKPPKVSRGYGGVARAARAAAAPLDPGEAYGCTGAAKMG